MPVEIELSRILIRELTDYQLIELREASADPSTARCFPIVIGLPEAQAIERRLKGIEVKRPQTHDLLANVIDRLGATLESVSITDLSEHTFFATLDLVDANGEKVRVDARPSDAIALGVAERVPIYVEEHVITGAMSSDDEPF